MPHENGSERPPPRPHSRTAAAGRDLFRALELISEASAEEIGLLDDAAWEGAPRECNFDACGAEYSSFDPSDCSYQPYGGGPRRQCER